MIKKIVVLGPESTGKSTLCALLAAHYKTIWVQEYAREYLLANGTNYTFDNLLDVAKGQLMLEERGLATIQASSKVKSVANNPKVSPIFIDTDMNVLKVWCEFVFNKCHHWILNQIAVRKYDLYLLCDTDLPWVKDELREYPDLVTRGKLYRYYKDMMVNQHIAWINIDGNYTERLQKAIAAVDKII